jgi:hypothetical protein
VPRGDAKGALEQGRWELLKLPSLVPRRWLEAKVVMEARFQ